MWTFFKIWPVIIGVIAIPAIVYLFLFAVIGGELSVIPGFTNKPFHWILEQTQWPYPHHYLPTLLVFLLCGISRRSKITVGRWVIENKWLIATASVALGVFPEAMWEIVEMVFMELGRQLEFFWPNSWITLFFLHFNEQRSDTVGDLVAALIGSVVAVVVIMGTSITDFALSDLVRKRTVVGKQYADRLALKKYWWWGKWAWYVVRALPNTIYFCVIILACLATWPGIYTLRLAMDGFLQFHVGYWIVFPLHQLALFVLFLLDYRMFRKDKYLKEQIQTVWGLYIFPLAFGMHLFCAPLMFPTYFVVWTYFLLYLSYTVMLRLKK